MPVGYTESVWPLGIVIEPVRLTVPLIAPLAIRAVPSDVGLTTILRAKTALVVEKSSGPMGSRLAESPALIGFSVTAPPVTIGAVNDTVPARISTGAVTLLKKLNRT